MKKFALVVVALTVLASACSNGSSVTAPGSTPKAQNVLADTPTHDLLNSAGEVVGSVTVVEALVGSVSGPGQYFQYWQTPEPSDAYYPVLIGTKGERLPVGARPQGVITPLNGIVPMRIEVQGPNGGKAIFNLMH